MRDHACTYSTLNMPSIRVLVWFSQVSLRTAKLLIMHGVGVPPSPQIRDPGHLRVLHDAFNMPSSPRTPQCPPLPGVGPLLDKGIHDAIALGEKDGSGRSLMAVYPIYASRLRLLEGKWRYFLIASIRLSGPQVIWFLFIIVLSVQFYGRGLKGDLV